MLNSYKLLAISGQPKHQSHYKEGKKEKKRDFVASLG
jgi:hypothetical protein